jgi:hypothetical protein
MQTIRQGDVLFIPVQAEELSRVQLHDITNKDGFRKDGVIQEGEATGHHHKLAVLENAEVFRPAWGDSLVRVGPNGVSIVHEEHATVTLAPNTTYKVHIAREFDYLREVTRYSRD